MPPGFDVFTRQKSPPPERRHDVTNGSSESRPRYVDTVRASASGGEPLRGSRYAAAYARAVWPMSPRLPSKIDEQAGRGRVLADLLQRTHAVRAERLEARSLRLHGDDVRADGIDEAATEARERLSGRSSIHLGFSRELEWEQLEARIEADDELATALPDDGRQPVGERRGGGRLVHRPEKAR